MANKNPRQVLDLRGTFCPMAFVKSRMFLDKASDGETVQIVFEDTPSNEPLIRSIDALGHRIVSKNDTPSPGTSDQTAAQAATLDPGNTLQLITINVQVKK